jgi:hypothetical protein
VEIEASLSDRKRTEFTLRSEALQAQFEAWRDDSGPGKPLEQIHTQVFSITTVLEKALRPVLKEVDRGFSRGFSTTRDAFETLRLAQARLAALERIWTWLFGRLAPRYSSWLAPYITAADAFVWATYRPVFEYMTAEASPEPPLVSLEPRTHTFLTSSADSDTDDLARFVPVPVIGVESSLLRTVPSIPLLGHYVGHLLYEQMQIAPEVANQFHESLAARFVPLQRVADWRAWAATVVADVIGTLAGGPAYAFALLPVIADAPERIGVASSGVPAPSDRVAVVAAALEHANHSEAARSVQYEWRNAYGDTALTEHAADVDSVVQTVTAAPRAAVGGRALGELLRFAPEDQERANRAARDLLALMEPHETDVRILFAACRTAFDTDPGGYAAGGVEQRVVRRIAAVEQAGTRAAPTQEVGEAADDLLTERIAAMIIRAHRQMGGTPRPSATGRARLENG